MIKQAIALLGLQTHAVSVLLFFTIMFVGMLAWIYRRNSKGLYENISTLPLEE